MTHLLHLNTGVGVLGLRSPHTMKLNPGGIAPQISHNAFTPRHTCAMNSCCFMYHYTWVLPPLSNSWIIIVIWLYIALNRALNIDCYWVGAVPTTTHSTTS